MTKRQRKGIILAGGSGTRLYPSTHAISKQLLPVYDKPMVFYPLCTLMQAEIREVCLISTPHDLPLFKKLLGDGSPLGMTITYREQAHPNGLAEAFLITKDWLDGSPSCLILGDNIFYGPGLSQNLLNASRKTEGASVFGYEVSDPHRYGVVELNARQQVVNIEEKPTDPKSNYAVVGLYFYDGHVCDIASKIKPSARGELEITDVNNVYIQRGALSVELLQRGTAWLDMGTHESLLQAANFIETLEQRQGIKIGCPEEEALIRGWITPDSVREKAKKFKNSSYGKYLLKLVEK